MRLGGCQCGAVRFSHVGEMQALYVCHCRECQKQSGSAFGISAIVSRAGLTLLSGEPRVWSRGTDSGHHLRCLFCGSCGTRLWHEAAVDSKTISIKAGCLDEQIDIRAAIHIWTIRKLAGVPIPEGAPSFPTEPPDDT